MVDDWKAIVRKGLLPWICLLCARPTDAGERICQHCDADLLRNTPACNRCALPLPTNREGFAVCGSCLLRPPLYRRLQAPYRYQAPADYLVHRLKFDGQLAYAPAIAQLMRPYAEQSGGADAIIPVPLHRDRLRERGFNQALEIARPLARWLHIPLDYHSCRRTRATARQTELSARDRGANVRGAFEVRRPIAFQRVAVIDDVVTTGSTVAEFTRALAGAGVKEVQVWAFARAVTPRR